MIMSDCPYAQSCEGLEEDLEPEICLAGCVAWLYMAGIDLSQMIPAFPSSHFFVDDVEHLQIALLRKRGNSILAS